MGYEPDNAVRDADYYLGQPSLNAPTFEGGTAKILGIQGTFDEGQFRRLFKGHHPDGDIMLPGLRNVSNRVGATDHTFNRDKGSSLLKFIAEDDRIAAVERKAEDKAIKLLESMAAVKVRKQSEIEKSKREATTPKTWRYPERKTGNILYVRFEHPESRENDPHSHSHVVIFNLTWDKAEGQFKTLQLRHIDRKEIGRVYHTELAKGMRKLGYDASWNGKQIEVGGVPKGLMDEFSRRSLGIEETKKRYQVKGLSRQGERKVQLFDRPEKMIRTLAEHSKEWLTRVTGSELAGLRGLASKARSSVRRDGLRNSLIRHLQTYRSDTIHHEVSHEREGRSR